MLGDTIVARATPRGFSSVSVIRLSGPGSVGLAKKIARTKAHLSVRVATLFPIFSSDGIKIDSAVFTFFKGPKSYTGEDVVEISCHGNPFIGDSVINRLCELGARTAEPGEYTKRAFLSGKIDLVQAESIGLLISSRSSEIAKKQSMILDGHLSKSIESLRASLLKALANLEFEFDMSEDENLRPSLKKELFKLLKNNGLSVEDRLSTYSEGRVSNEGIRVVLCGQPNAGKSTLMNALLGVNRSIISPVPGTTRDTITSDLVLGGVPITLIDTAGIDRSKNQIEAQGITRAKTEIKNADIVLSVFSGDTKALDYIEDKEQITVFNKVDKYPSPNLPPGSCSVSAIKNKGIESLKKLIEKKVLSITLNSNDVFLNTIRQKNSLTNCLRFLKKASSNIEKSEPLYELAAADIRSSIDCLEVFLGKTTTEEVLSEVFSGFCVGK
jgi:tRNA modification GTPase